MKKILIASMAAIGLWACSSQEEPQPPVLNEKMPQTGLVSIRSIEEARICAMDAYNRFYGISRTVPQIKNVRACTSARSRSTENNDTAFYIVNLDNGEGYAVIAANRDLEPVLAITEKGNIESLDSLDNPGSKIFFDELFSNFNPVFQGKPINDSISTIQPNPWWTGNGDNGENPNPVTQYKTEVTITHDDKEPRAPYCWGQDFPEGRYFKHKVAGCGNVAAMLLLSYFEVPSWLSFQIAGYKAVDWELIKSHYQSREAGVASDFCGDIDQPAHREISDLCFTIGKLNDSSENEDGTTSTTIDKVRKTMISFRTLGFNPHGITSGMPNARGALDDGIIYVGASTEKGNGHAFIIDGYKSTITTSTTYKREPGETSWTVVDRSYQTEVFNHINWGWYGIDNGYFALSVFCPENGNEYDSGIRYPNEYNYTKKFNYFVVTKK